MFHFLALISVCLKFSDAQVQCPHPMVLIQGAKPNSCYALRDPVEGTFWMYEADFYCNDQYQAYLPTPENKQQLAAIAQWAKPQIYGSNQDTPGLFSFTLNANN